MNLLRKSSLTLLLSAWGVWAWSQSITLNSQTAVNNFNPALTSLTDLSIFTTVAADPIVDLSPLGNLTTINGSLLIQSNEALTNLNGLSNVTTIGSGLLIQYNDVLTNVDGLASITQISTDLYIRNNPLLQNLDGLNDLSSVAGDLTVFFNNSLSDCCALHILLSTAGAVGGTVTINNNPSDCSSANQIINDICGVSISTTASPPCANANNGSIQVTAFDLYTLPLSYNWEETGSGAVGSGSSNSNFFSIPNLGTGTYNVTVTDAAGTSDSDSGILLSQLPGSVFEVTNVSVTNTSNGFSNGGVFVEVQGGNLPYDYAWTGPELGSQSNVDSTSFPIGGLPAGDYSITVTDDNGDDRVFSVTLLDETIESSTCLNPLDIVILNDVSGSVDAAEYEQSQQFFVDLIDEINIGPSNTDSRVAIIEWASTGDQAEQIPMTGDIATYQGYLGMARAFFGGTDPISAMEFGKNYLDSLARPFANKVIVLSTDAFPDQVPPSIVGLADGYKAEGIHIVTIAFDDANQEPTLTLLQQASSIPNAPPLGADSYDLLNDTIASQIVNEYLCPVDPGSTASFFFHRDGSISINSITPDGLCPFPDNYMVDISVDALQQLSIPASTPVTFYNGDPTQAGATPLLTWQIPCAIPAGSSENFNVTIPALGPSNIFVVLNDNGSQYPPISFPLTDITELVYANNTANMEVCVGPTATLTANKYTSTPSPICNNTVIYTIDVCNVGGVDASGVTITDQVVAGFVLQDMTVNDNGCATYDGSVFGIPASCCVSLNLTYNVSAAALGLYDNQDVFLDGPNGQVYVDFDGADTESEDVNLDGTLNCPSTLVEFSKEVNQTDMCDDGFVSYTFTINNELNIPLQNLVFEDILPAPVTWTFQPYALNGLSISNPVIQGDSAAFVIDYLAPETVASFRMDAYLGEWDNSGVLSNTASLGNVLDLDNGGLQTLSTNTVTTNVSVPPVISLADTLFMPPGDSSIAILPGLENGADSIHWSTDGDGILSDSTLLAVDYTLGDMDVQNGGLWLQLYAENGCGAAQDSVFVVPPPCELSINEALIGDCSDNGTPSDPSDDTYEVTLNASVSFGGVNYQVSDGTFTYGPFAYSVNSSITLPADGNTYTLTFTDGGDAACTQQVQVSQASCSDLCLLDITSTTIGNCSNNGTATDPSDDTFTVTINASALNGSTGYQVTDGIQNYGPFPYQTNQVITLPADGMTYTLVLTDNGDAACTNQVEVSQVSCSNLCVLTITETTIGDCDDNGTPTDITDDFYMVGINAAAINPGTAGTYSVNDGTNTYGPFNYGTPQSITMPADGVTYALIFTDTDDPSCSSAATVSQNACPSYCVLSVDELLLGSCDDNGTDGDPDDDFFSLDFSVTALNPGFSETFQIFISQGTSPLDTLGPFAYGQNGSFSLPADGNNYTLAFMDSDDSTCVDTIRVFKESCSVDCIDAVYFHTQDPLCAYDYEGAIIIDSIEGGTGDFSYSFDRTNFYPLDSLGSPLDSIAHLYAGDYHFSLVDNGNGCTYDFPFSIVQPLPFYLMAGDDVNLQMGESVQLLLNSNLPYETLEWVWSDTTTLSCSDCINPVARPLRTTTYYLNGISPEGCLSYDTLNIIVDTTHQVFIPNAFSPNGDGQNDIFSIYPGSTVSEVLDVQVYDRWGEMVFKDGPYAASEAHSVLHGWDGTFKGRRLHSNVFIYLVRVRLVDGREIRVQGDLTLLR